MKILFINLFIIINVFYSCNEMENHQFFPFINMQEKESNTDLCDYLIFKLQEEKKIVEKIQDQFVLLFGEIKLISRFLKENDDKPLPSSLKRLEEARDFLNKAYVTKQFIFLSAHLHKIIYELKTSVDSGVKCNINQQEEKAELDQLEEKLNQFLIKEIDRQKNPIYVFYEDIRGAFEDLKKANMQKAKEIIEKYSYLISENYFSKFKTLIINWLITLLEGIYNSVSEDIRFALCEAVGVKFREGFIPKEMLRRAKANTPEMQKAKEEYLENFTLLQAALKKAWEANDLEKINKIEDALAALNFGKEELKAKISHQNKARNNNWMQEMKDRVTNERK